MSRLSQSPWFATACRSLLLQLVCKSGFQRDQVMINNIDHILVTLFCHQCHQCSLINRNAMGKYTEDMHQGTQLGTASEHKKNKSGSRVGGPTDFNPTSTNALVCILTRIHQQSCKGFKASFWNDEPAPLQCCECMTIYSQSYTFELTATR
jgi:hypothetical protein